APALRPPRRSHLPQGGRGEQRGVSGFRSHSSPGEISAGGGGNVRKLRGNRRFGDRAGVRTNRESPAPDVGSVTGPAESRSRPGSVAVCLNPAAETGTPVTLIITRHLQPENRTDRNGNGS